MTEKTDRSIVAHVAAFVQNKEEIGAAEIAAFLITLVRQEWHLSDEVYDRGVIGKSLVWRGATATARDIIKKPGVAEAILDEAQDELPFEGHSEFVRYRQDEDGTWQFKRRRSLTREEYEHALALLRAKARDLDKKIERMQNDYDRAAPYWTAGLSFEEAFTLASEAPQP